MCAASAAWFERHRHHLSLPTVMPADQRGGRVVCPPETRKAPLLRGFLPCAEEDSSLHPVIPDQALNLAEGFPPLATPPLEPNLSGEEDCLDASDEGDVVTNVVTDRLVRRSQGLDGAVAVAARGAF